MPAGVAVVIVNNAMPPPLYPRTSSRYRFWKNDAGATKRLPANAAAESARSR